MIADFFNRRVIIKRITPTGKVRRFTSTATVDGMIEEERKSASVQANFKEEYIGFFEAGDPVRKDFKLIDKNTRVEYIVTNTMLVDHPITGTTYLEATLRKDPSKQDGSKN